MKPSTEFLKGLFKAFLYSLLSLFLVPAITLAFVEYAQPHDDEAFEQWVAKDIGADARMSAQEKEDRITFFRSHPPSTMCSNTDPALIRYQEGVCALYSENWQFHVAKKAAVWTIAGGGVILLAVLVLSVLAFADRSAQYRSFIAGWQLLRFSSALGVLLQGGMLVWLSFWLTAYFLERYSVKLILVIGLAVGAGVLLTMVSIFKKAGHDSEVDGELVDEASAPALWARARELATRLKTDAPRQIIAGIDTNFFVTEAPLTVNGKTLTGRSLFVSIPLLRVLDQYEADAVLTHELAHLRGGDTASSAALGPKLVQYDQYCRAMASGGLTIVVYQLMNLYRVIFEIALKSDSREREFLADRIAAKIISGKAIVQSLIKIAAYARYRSQIERGLFEQNQKHGGSLGIAGYVASGLAPYATSPEFVDEMKSARVPHPFDSHPMLEDRMRNVEHTVPEQEYGSIVTSTPLTSWADAISTAPDIEHRLWTAYEEQFAAAHEHSQAYRYEPANEEEQAIVLKYFPTIAFDLKNEQQIIISYAGITAPGQDEIPWDSVHKTKYEDGIGGDVLTIEHPEKGFFGAKTTKIKLPGLGKQKDNFKAAFGHYWQRHQVMRRG
ncbi:M48 family metallopeptidase [Undibacterium sp. TJN25]|uniref:M48 family metallopeptidase n=1 Tax=Undibacterium sp. TJN25 TaxID=3413056 RepID=UPI003BEFC16D